MKFLTHSLLAATVLMTLAGTAQAQIINVQTFSDSLNGSAWSPAIAPQPYLGTVWTNAFAEGYNATDVPYSNGIPSTVGFTLTSPSLNVSNNGSPAGTVITNATTFANPDPLTLTITGLNDSQGYQLDFVSAYDGGYGGTFAIDSYTSQSTSGNSALTTFKHGQNFALFKDVVPVDHQIVVTITPGTNFGGFAMLNGFQIAPAGIPEPSTYALMLGGLAFLAFCVRRKALR